MSMNKLSQYIKDHKKDKAIMLFFDIETYQYNEKVGREKPSEYKNVVYSVACSYFDDENKIQIERSANFLQFFEKIFNGLRKPNGQVLKNTPVISLVAHNSNKYDNHFLRSDLIYYYDCQVKNMYLKNAVENEFSFKVNQITKDEKEEGIILEKRVKSSNNLEMDFFIFGVHFRTIDSLMKTNLSIRSIGKKCLDHGFLTEEQLKTDYDYLKYNLDEDLTEDQAHIRALHIYDQLDEDELTYIDNDVIILGTCVYHYSELFYGFDFSKITFTSNILEYYNDNDETSLQLLNKVGEKDNQIKVTYTDYRIGDVNFYDWLKPFYRGGLNFYNDRLIGTIVNGVFSLDINSSYPYVMYFFKVPTFYKSGKFFNKKTRIRIEPITDELYHLYQVDKNFMNEEILPNIKSQVLRKMFVKYYSTNDTVNINDYTIRLLRDICHIELEFLEVYGVTCFECEFFGSREKLFQNYQIKTKGKQKKEIIMQDPFTYTFTEKDNPEKFSNEEVANAKVLLNGLYGIPALRAYFNLFRYNEVTGELENHENGFKNSERNIVFSIFVTSVAVYNLLSPLKNLDPEEIDNSFIYCDTDSLYLKKDVYDKIDKSLLDPISLGAWDVEHEDIKKMYVLNHKKYCYLLEDEKIEVRSGGIPLDTYDRNMYFEDFIETQFSDGVKIKNQKSILNKQGTISIYQSSTDLERGKRYKNRFSLNFEQEKEEMFAQIRKEVHKNGWEDMLYIESELGTFSMSELYPVKNSVEKTSDLFLLGYVSKNLKNKIGVE